jgi:hypothetical protein
MDNHQVHYHIRWSGVARLDWESFSTPAQADVSANQLMRRGETYTIEQYDQSCTRCREVMTARPARLAFRQSA